MSLMIVLLGACAAIPGASRGRAECAVGAVALDQMLSGLGGKPLVLAPAVGKLTLAPAMYPLPPELARRWDEAVLRNLFDVCPELSSRLPMGWRYATEAEQRSFPQPDIHFFGAPVVLGSLALVQYDFSCSGLCGNYRVIVYRRHGGAWRPVGLAAAAFS